MNRGSAGTVGGLPQPCEVDLQFIRENKGKRKEALHFTLYGPGNKLDQVKKCLMAVIQVCSSEHGHAVLMFQEG